MRILMTTDTVGGVWTYTLKLIQALRPRGHEFLLVTSGAMLTPSQQRQVRGLSGVKLVETSFRLEWMQDPWHDIDAMGDLLLSLERETAPDLVHLNDYAQGALPFQAPRIVVAHSCVWSWWRHVRGGAPGGEYAEYFRRVRRGIHAADHVVAPSAAMLRDVRDIYGRRPASSVIANGLDLPETRKAGDGKEGIGKEEFVFSMGRVWDEAKNMRGLDQAAAKIRWPVKIAGAVASPGGERCHRFRHAGTLGPLAGEAAQALLARSAVYALPARYEPFGLSVLEAALAGCALVLGDIPSLRENWDGAAVFADPARPDDIARRVNAIIDDPERLARYQALARRRAARYTAERMAAGYDELYRRLSHGMQSLEVMQN